MKFLFALLAGTLLTLTACNPTSPETAAGENPNGTENPEATDGAQTSGENTPANDDSQSATAETPQDIEEIRDVYQKTETAIRENQYQIDSLKAECAGGEMMATFYSEAGQLRKVRFFEASSHGSSIESYYFKNGQLYFVFIDQGIWSFDPQNPDSTIEEVEQHRLYFVDNEPVKCLYKKAKFRGDEKNPIDQKPNEEVSCDAELLQTIEAEVQRLKQSQEAGQLKSDC